MKLPSPGKYFSFIINKKIDYYDIKNKGTKIQRVIKK